jgi:phosphatidate cytidylyltransferase
VSEPSPATTSVSNNLQIRIFSAVALGAIALGLTWYGGLPFRALAALVGLLIYWEWQNITGYDKYGLLELAAPAAVAAAMVLVILNFPVWESLIPAIFATLFSIAACVRRNIPYWFPLGVPYAIVPVLAITSLRSGSASGLWAVMFLFAVVWATDIFAYFAGRAFGGPKLAPKISPNKTWTGAVGGALAGVAAGMGVAALHGSPGLMPHALTALALTMAAQCGDLFESHVKRLFGAKDSGTIIPGHGGVMDRVDGLVAAAVMLYLICVSLGGGAFPAVWLFPA